MLIEKKSMLTGIVHVRDIDVTVSQIEEWLSGILIQEAMPHLSLDDREFLLSGSTPEEWEEFYGTEEE